MEKGSKVLKWRKWKWKKVERGRRSAEKVEVSEKKVEKSFEK